MNAVGRLIHADWSIHPRKRWAAFATRASNGSYIIDGLSRFSMSAGDLLVEGKKHGVLIGFDFPIGLPNTYANSLKVSYFPDFLRNLAIDPLFADFALPADTYESISAYRPFYPARPGGTSRDHLVRAHNLTAFGDLLRECEKKTATRPAACSIFWTLGGNQVGRAASSGWLEILVPLSSNSSVRFWPFDGPIQKLTSVKRVTVVETYPAEAMRFLGVSDGKKFSKRRQADRIKVQDRIRAAGAEIGIAFGEGIHAAVTQGFGSDPEGEDRFDALMGLMGMAAVLSGKRLEGSSSNPKTQEVEGWILGQSKPEQQSLR